jgi:hypothetical protein
MSRRSGKAASRKARQQRRARQAQAPGPRPAARANPAAESAGVPPWAEEGEVASIPEARPVGATATATATATAAPVRPAPFVAGMSSRLGEAAQAEYHYVGRDLRNTAILVLIMTALLAGAVILVNLAGVAPS